MNIILPDAAILEIDLENNYEITVVSRAKCRIVLKINDHSPEKSVISIVSGKDSVANCVLMYNCLTAKKTSLFLNRELAENSMLISLIACTDLGNHSLHRTTVLAEKSVLDEAELFLGKKTQSFSLTHEVINKQPDTKATVLTKGVLLEKSSAFCKGNMIIAPSACRSSSWLGQHVLLLSKEAKADAIPCLEIKNNDVKAYHSATVTPLNEQHLFYLTSRGISLTDAKQMIAEAFLLPLIERCESIHIKELIHSQITNTFTVLYANN